MKKRFKIQKFVVIPAKAGPLPTLPSIEGRARVGLYSGGGDRKVIFYVSLLLLSSLFSLLSFHSALAAANNVPAVDLNSPGFHLLQCDGPAMPKDLEQQQTAKIGHTYQPCNFQGLMIEIQYLLNVMTIAGVLAAIGGFAYAGYLYVTGTQENIKKARGMFPKIAIGFILILTAWFIVYQILAWLTGSAGAAALLGNGS